MTSASRSGQSIGARLSGDGRCHFCVWAPDRKSVQLRIVSPNQALLPMQKDEHGYWRATAEGIGAGARYLYVLDEQLERPDPASQSQPDGVHKPSQVVDPHFAWSECVWSGLALSRHVFYEIHVGTFTPEGTFDAIIPQLDGLADIGITAIELMPIAQFPGARNWGYDGVYPFAAQTSYGGPAGLRRLVDAAHSRGIAIILDVVYNHLGPEGNYLNDFGPYFTDCYRTPWGRAVNFDGAHSGDVRRFFIENAVAWVEDYHVDGLRLDATHFMFDSSPLHFLAELELCVKAAGDRANRRVHLFPESDANDVKWIRSIDAGGFGLDSQWNDDFQHALLTMLPGADAGAYAADYNDFEQLAKAYREGFVYSGEYSPFRKRRHGTSSRGFSGEKFVVFMQNHDQVGNRPKGDRLSSQISFESTKLAAAGVLLSPFIPMLFMGEEYGETAPFLYFVSHSDDALIDAVRKGRAEEFAHFSGGEEAPDPQAEETYNRSKLDLGLRKQPRHWVLWQYHRELLRLRRETRSLVNLDRSEMRVASFPEQRVLAIFRSDGDDAALLVLNFSTEPQTVKLDAPTGTWQKVLDSADRSWEGPGAIAADALDVERSGVSLNVAGESAVVYHRL